MRRFILGVALSAMTGLGPAWALAADQDTAQRIAGAMRSSGRLSDYSVGVQFEDGTAWLSGRVANAQQMAEALEIASQYPGVTDVVNQLEVQNTRAPAQADVNFANGNADSEDSEVTQTGLLLNNTRRRTKIDPSETFGMRRLAPPGKPPAQGAQAQKQPAKRLPTTKPPQSMSSRPGYNTRSSAEPVQQYESTEQTESQVQYTAAVSTRDPSDPGDPLASSQQVRFAPSASRRFADEPITRARAAQPKPLINSSRNTATRPVSYNGNVASAPSPVAMSAPTGAPSQGIPAQQAGFHHRRAAPCPPGAGYGDGGMSGDGMGGAGMGGPVPVGGAGMVGGPQAYDNARLPNYAWPSYATYPNYAAVTYPTQYSATAWPYIGPFYPYPQVPLGWRKVSLEWDDGWWFLDFHDRHCHH